MYFSELFGLEVGLRYPTDESLSKGKHGVIIRSIAFSAGLMLHSHLQA